MIGVDVLSVMTQAASVASSHEFSMELREARAAVAELIEVIRAGAEHQTHSGPVLRYGPVESERLAAALARVTGGDA